ncbi:MAG: fumarylacetoacetate hydrolase family protein [SAR324 cluster bacterium]|nr:fumarylacetoacetate hydrolase family protein [SAR324 cluster bacterium]
MDLKAAIDSIWECTNQGIYYPPEWKGKLSVEEGYRVQLGLLDRYLDTGERHAGWKVGLTAKAIQEQIGFHEPVFGFLLERDRRTSGVVISSEELVAPSFEIELCLTVGKSLQGPKVSLHEANAAVTVVQPAFEIVEMRGDFTADFSLALADNVQQKFYVTGEPVPVDGARADLSQATVEIFINGERVDAASGSNVMGGPAASVAWLANRLADFGRGLEEGVCIMSGSFTRQYPIAQGDVIEASFDPYGKVSAEFS